MPAIESNPNFFGALTLPELVSTQSVCLVDINDKTYTRAEVMQLSRESDYTPTENYTYVLLLQNGELNWHATSTLGVEADHQGAWEHCCLSAPDNPALEEYVDLSSKAEPSESGCRHRSMTGASWFFDNLT